MYIPIPSSCNINFCFFFQPNYNPAEPEMMHVQEDQGEPMEDQDIGHPDEYEDEMDSPDEYDNSNSSLDYSIHSSSDELTSSDEGFSSEGSMEWAPSTP